MQIIQYDGSFYGLIFALAPFLKKRGLPDGIDRENTLQPSLMAFEEKTPNSTSLSLSSYTHDPEIFRLPGVTKETWQNAWHAFLSETKGIEMGIARYLLLALEKRGRVDSLMTDERVRFIQRMARRVLAERHRFMGLLRFRNIGQNLFYASIHSDSFILPILAPFFVDRLGDQQWLIHDRRRQIAAIYNLKTWIMIEKAANDIPDDSANEAVAQNLWQNFFDSIAVRERLNLALQQKFIPKKYRQDLIEKMEQS
jgi:probable DNA metabolism protein